MSEYIWEAGNNLCTRVLLTDQLWDEYLRPAIEELDIQGWYSKNPEQDSNTFEVSLSDSLKFNPNINMLHEDLFLFYGQGVGMDMMLSLQTARNPGGAVITNLQITGRLRDLYDWAPGGDDDYEDSASRVQALYKKGLRDAGGIYIHSAILDRDLDWSMSPPKSDDFEYIRTMYLLTLIHMP